MNFPSDMKRSSHLECNQRNKSVLKSIKEFLSSFPFLFLALFFAFQLLFSEGVTSHSEWSQTDCDIDLALIDPRLENRSLISPKGGVVRAPNMHFEAHWLKYTRPEGGNRGHLTARGGIFVKFFKSNFIGEELEFDFNSNTGVLRNARLQVGSWVIGGSDIYLKANGTYDIRRAWAETVTFPGIYWGANAERILIRPDRLINFHSLTLKTGQQPLARFKSISFKQQTLEHFPLGLSLQWGSKNNRKLGLRYTLYADRYNSHFQLDRWWTKQWGLGIRFEGLEKNPTWSTSHYLMRRSDIRRKWHFLCNGRFSYKWPDRKAQIKAKLTRASHSHFIERLSQSREFKGQGSTQIEYREQWPFGVVKALAVVKINPYETRKQQLPSILLLPKSSHWENWHFYQTLETAQLVLSYPKHSHQKTFAAWRTIWNAHLYRHQRLGQFLTATGEISTRGYAVSQKTEGTSSRFFTPRWDGYLQLPFVIKTENFTISSRFFAHHILSKNLYSRVRDLYVFDLEESAIEDHTLNWGFRGAIDHQQRKILDYSFSINHPIGEKGRPRPRRLFVDLTCRLTPRIECDIRNWIDRDRKKIDRSAVRLRATLSDQLAALIEYDKRNERSWRGIGDDRDWICKWHSENQLLSSELSDRRHFISSSIYWILDPELAIKGQIRRGINHRYIKNSLTTLSHLEWGVGVVAILPGQWKMQMAYEHRVGKSGLRRYSIKLITNHQAPIVTKPNF